MRFDAVSVFSVLILTCLWLLLTLSFSHNVFRIRVLAICSMPPRGSQLTSLQCPRRVVKGKGYFLTYFYRVEGKHIKVTGQWALTSNFRLPYSLQCPLYPPPPPFSPLVQRIARLHLLLGSYSSTKTIETALKNVLGTTPTVNLIIINLTN